MRLGVLDIGSNTVHLLLVDAHPGARPVPFASHKRPLSLVQFLESDGNINDAGQHELIEFVLEAWEFAAKHKAEDLLAFCTSAIREATNGPAVLARVKHETTVTLQELTGSEEASMTFFAVRRWYGWGAGPILNLDIGGGSFEMAYGEDELPELATSVPLGASRLTRDWLQEDPPSAKSVKELRRYIRATLKPAVRDFEKLGRPNLVAGTSKTFRSLARIAGAAPSAAGPYVKRELFVHWTWGSGRSASRPWRWRTGSTCPASPRPARPSSWPAPWWRKRPWKCSSSPAWKSARGRCARDSSCAGWTSWSSRGRCSRHPMWRGRTRRQLSPVETRRRQRGPPADAQSGVPQGRSGVDPRASCSSIS